MTLKVLPGGGEAASEHEELADCPWCGPASDLEILDTEDSEPVSDESEGAAVFCNTCMAWGPAAVQGCHDPDEDGPLEAALVRGAAVAWNSRHEGST